MKSIGSNPDFPAGWARRFAGHAPLWLASAMTVALPALARAQSQERDFLFRTPAVSVSLRTGYNVARAGGDVFDFTRENLTLERADFGAFAIGADVGVRVAQRFDLVFGFSHAGTSVRSEFRDWVDQDDLPITQRTRFAQTPLTAGLRYYLVPRGRQIGRFVWIPARVVPYIGAAAGAVHYSFEQDGDWVDFQDQAVFNDRFESSGWTGIAQAIGGVEFGLTPWLALITEGRLSVATGEPGPDFVGFDGIDLSGLQVTAGLSFRM